MPRVLQPVLIVTLLIVLSLPALAQAGNVLPEKEQLEKMALRGDMAAQEKYTDHYCITAPEKLTPACEYVLTARAARGDGTSQLILADNYCRYEKRKNNSVLALKWMQAAAKSHDADTAAYGLFELGNHYMALYKMDVYNDNALYDPVHDRPAPYCTGSPKKPDFAKAEKYFNACTAKMQNPAVPVIAQEGCQRALGHIHLRRKEFAKAYAWYAKTLMDYIDGTPLNDRNPPPLLKTPLMRTNGHVGQQAKHNRRLARLAASHLKSAEVRTIDAQTRGWYDGMSLDVEKWIAQNRHEVNE